MAKKIKIMALPGKVAPMKEGDFPFAVSPYGERFIFDSIATEHVRRSGTEIDYFVCDNSHDNVDPLYGETVEAAWKGPYRLVGLIEWPDSNPESREEGFRSTYQLGCWIPRTEFENASCPIPSEGDVVRVWKLPFFDTASVNSEVVPGAEYAFTVVDVDDEGHLFDNPDFVGFRLDLRRNTEFTPERRVTPP